MFITNLNTTLATFLQSKPEFQLAVKKFYKHSKSTNNTLEDLRQRKNDLNKKAKHINATSEDKLEASETIKLYNHVLKLEKEKEAFKNIEDDETKLS